MSSRARGAGPFGVSHTDGRLLLVDVADGTTRVVARGRFLFAGWTPSVDTFAYATTKQLFLGPAEHRARRIAAIPRGEGVERKRWPPAGTWLGWSPDGSYIGLSFGQGRGIRVIDVSTGKLRVLRPFGPADYTNVQWRR